MENFGVHRVGIHVTRLLLQAASDCFTLTGGDTRRKWAKSVHLFVHSHTFIFQREFYFYNRFLHATALFRIGLAAQEHFLRRNENLVMK